MRPSRALPVVLVVCAAAFAGCGDASPSNDAGSTSTASASATASSTSTMPSGGATGTAPDQPSGQPSARASRTPHLPRDQVEAAALHTSVLVRSSADTSREEAVVAAWIDYWQATSDTFFFLRPTQQLRAVARDEALSSVLNYIGTLKHDKHRVVGWAKDHVTSVQVDGDRARVRDCTENFTFSVDVDGDPVTRPTPFYEVTGTLQKDAGRWYVTRTHSTNLTSSCLP
jgi:hypothetical protein